MVCKVMGNEAKGFNLDRTILNIVRTMQPISAEDILLAVEEEEDCMLSKIEVNKHLEQMVIKHILTKVELPNGKEMYMTARK